MIREWGSVLLSTALIAWLLMSAAVAQQPTAASQQSSERQSYELGDVFLPTARVYVHVSKSGLGHEHAVVGTISRGRLRFDVERDAGEIVFDLRTFRADTAEARKYLGIEGDTSAGTQKQVTDNMLGPDVLNVAEHAEATFRISSALPHAEPSERGLPRYVLSGELVLHGTKRPVKLLVEAESRDGWRHVRGGFTLRQTDFGIKPFTKAFGAIGVANDLRVWGDMWVAERSGIAQRQTKPAAQ